MNGLASPEARGTHNTYWLSSPATDRGHWRESSWEYNPGYGWVVRDHLPLTRPWEEWLDCRNGRGLTPADVRRRLPVISGRVLATRMFDEGFSLFQLGPGLYWTRGFNRRTSEWIFPFSLCPAGRVLGPATGLGHTVVRTMLEQYAGGEDVMRRMAAIQEAKRLRGDV